MQKFAQNEIKKIERLGECISFVYIFAVVLYVVYLFLCCFVLADTRVIVFLYSLIVCSAASLAFIILY